MLNEKAIFSIFVSSIIEEAHDEIIVSKFVDLVLINAKRDVIIKFSIKLFI